MLRTVIRFVLITLGIAVVGLALGVIGSLNADQDGLGAIGVVGMLTFLFSPALTFIYFWWMRRGVRKEKRRQEQEEVNRERVEAQKDFLRKRFLERQRLIDSVDRHRSALTRNLERAIKTNDYGSVISDKTDEALTEFFASVNLDFGLINESEADELVREQLDFRRSEDRDSGYDSNNIPFDGHAFEKWVAEALETFGWEASVTSGSGDQGIDVIAMLDGKKVGIQCKLYSSSVGNKAVQEAHAGKAYYDADVVAVVTNADFTASARDLAQVTGVKLLSHHDLPDFASKVFD